MALSLQIGLDAITSYRRLSYTPWHALAEFVDNSTQAYFDNRSELDELYSRQNDRLEVSIVYSPDDRLIRVSDNSSGMNHTELERALHIAHRPPHRHGRSRYGMGMKTAACWLGNRWTIRTKKYKDDIEYCAEIDVGRIAAGDADLRETVHRGLDTELHYTVIEITDLHRVFKGRTLGKIRDFLRSMYRQDFRDGNLKLLWNAEELAWQELDEQLLRGIDGNMYKKAFAFSIENGKEANGWVGVLASGSRSKAGFSILHCSRVVRGWPDAWRPAAIYGQIQGSNDLINQRLVGEIHLDAFDVSHTKDDILWIADEEELVEERLCAECRDYRDVAKAYRKGSDQRGPENIEMNAAVEELKRELDSPQVLDTIRLEVNPDPPAITKTFLAIARSEEGREPTFTTQLDDIHLKVYLTADKSINDPYFVCDATKYHEVCVVINQQHPHWRQLRGSEGVLNFLRHCVYDALAEHLARHRKSTVEPDTIKLYKDRFLRIPFEIELDPGMKSGGGQPHPPIE